MSAFIQYTLQGLAAGGFYALSALGLAVIFGVLGVVNFSHGACYMLGAVIAAVLLGGVSIFGGRGALHGVIAGVLLIGTLGSALRLAGITSDIINVITGLLLIASVVSSSLLAWLQVRRSAAIGKRKGRAGAVKLGLSCLMMAAALGSARRRSTVSQI